jgi:Raf kinase inhibitor-like YbhB/YbcL family protein
MEISSPAFADGGKIPDKYTKYGANLIPPLEFADLPENAMSLVLIVDDPDAPKGTFTHWLLFNVDPETEEIEEDAVPANALEGRNDYGEAAYGGPKPPSGEHRYFFKLYALNAMLSLKSGVSRDELEEAMENHLISEATLMGRYAH